MEGGTDSNYELERRWRFKCREGKESKEGKEGKEGRESREG